MLLLLLLLVLVVVVKVAVAVVLIFHRGPFEVVRRGQRCEVLTHLEDAFDGKVALGQQVRRRAAVEVSLLLLLLEVEVRVVVVEAGGARRFTATRGRG